MTDPVPRRDFLKQLTLASAGVLAPGLLVRSASAQTPAPAGGASARAPEMVLYCCGYAHLDTEWRWSYPIVIREFLRKTLEDNFPLFEQFPHYIFNFTGANRYRLMKEYFPAQFEKLKEYVRAGRWFPAGSAWEEGIVDEPSSEAVLRHVLYGNQYFRRELGQASNEFMLPDSFGFPASLPTLLSHAGLKGFSTQKLTWGSAVGIPFNFGVWVGPDGRGVMAALNGTSYTSKIKTDLTSDAEWIGRLKDDVNRCGVGVDFRYFGVGDRGGAVDASSLQWLETSLRGSGPLKIVSATGAAIFDAVTPEQVAKLPRYQGDLLLTQHSAGTPSSQAFMKKMNRKNEFRADESERTSLAADLHAGLAYPRAALTQGWQMVLAGQFHDILAGTCKPDAYGYAWNDGLLARNLLTQCRDAAVGALSRNLDTQTGGGIPLIVFNPLSTARTDIVEAEIAFPGGSPRAVRVFGPDGGEVPAQVGRRHETKLEIVFLAAAEPVSFAVFEVRPDDAGMAAAAELHASPQGLENHRYRVELDGSGDVRQVWDKAGDRPLLRETARLAFLRENPDKYPAWNMAWDDAMRAPYAYVDGPPEIAVVENGPARVAVRVTRRAQGSTIVQTLRLAAGDAGHRLEFDTFIDWHTRESALKAVFPLRASNPKATYNWEAGTVERSSDSPTLYEWPSHQWFDLTDASGAHGVSVLEDCKYGSDKPDDHTLRLTLMYTPGAKRAGNYHDQTTQDFGRHRFVYALLGHDGDWRQGGTQWQAARLNQPMTAFAAEAHPGSAGKSLSLLRVAGDQVMVKAFKRAEESDEVVVRFQELTGSAARGVGVGLSSPILEARELDGQENPIGPAQVRDGKLVFDVGGYSLKTFALKVGPAPSPASVPAAVPLDLPFDTTVTTSDGEAAKAAMNAIGRAYPAEMFPERLLCGGVPFRLGPARGDNAVACNGQTLALPAGNFTRLHLIAASSTGRMAADFTVDGRTIPVEIQNWDGFIGQPDYRLWNIVDIPEISYDWDAAFQGVAPGYLCPDSVAWYCSHRHSPAGANEVYDFAYLFRYTLAIAPGARALVLPVSKTIRLFAVTAVGDGYDVVRPVSSDLKVM